MKNKEISQNNEIFALIYCRVSTSNQATDGSGLESQEQRCVNFATLKGYKVDKVFKDVFSGGGDFTGRPALAELIKYIDEFKYRRFVFIIDDITRVARDVMEHFKIRKALKLRGVELMSPNFKFENSPEGEYVETIMAATSQFHRKSNTRQTVQKQRARLARGYWSFNPPPGYISKTIPGHGKVLTPLEPKASIIKEALEGFASGRFERQTDVLNFLRSSKYSEKPIYLQLVKRILINPVYAGYMEYSKWEVDRMVGRHEPLVSKEVFDQVQFKLNGSVKKYARNIKNDSFPLRGNIGCIECGKPLTASFSTGKMKNRFGYYRCNKGGCVNKNISISKSIIENGFMEEISKIKPKEEVVEYGLCILREVFNNTYGSVKDKVVEIKQDIKNSIDRESKLMNLIMNSSNKEVISSYESQLINEKQLKLGLTQKLIQIEDGSISIETPLKMMEEFLKNPKESWVKSDLDLKNIIFNMVFEDRLSYRLKVGFETPKISIIYNLFSGLSGDKTHDVEMAGVEPASI